MKLIVSMKNTEEMFEDFKKAATRAKKGKTSKGTHYEIAFESDKDFHRFLKNIKILMAILHHKPASAYELAKICGRDVANIKKILSFFEEIGAVRIKRETRGGRKVKKPVVDYSKIEFDLKAA